MDFHEAVRIILKWHGENQAKLVPVLTDEVREAFEIASAYLEAADALDPALEAATRLRELTEENNNS